MGRTFGLCTAALAVALTPACGGNETKTAPGAGTDVAVRVEGGPALELTAGDGTTLLRSVSGSTVFDGVPYAAFGFSTEEEPELEAPSFDHPPEVPTPAASSRHVATKVRSRHATAKGYAVELDTDDPGGRTLTVEVEQAADGAAYVDVGLSDAAGVTAVFASFESARDEAFHGFGGRRESTDLRGRTFQNWVYDYRFPKVDTSYYSPAPMFLSSAGYGVWVDTDRIASFRMASDADAWRVAVAGPSARLFLVPRGGSDGLRILTDVTGRHRPAPSWSMGPTLSRTVQLFVDQPDVYRQKVADDVQHILSDGLGVEAYAYEGWAELDTSTVKATNATLVAAGVHPMLYLRCYVSNDAAGTEPHGRFDEAVQNGFVAKRADGTPYFFPSPFDRSDAAVVDFTNPDARTWWKGLVRQMLDLGADGFMNDFGEQVLNDMVFADGSTGETLHNRYPVLQHQTTREAIDEYVADHPDREIYFFGRAGYAGAPGSAAYENAEFPGDETTDYLPTTGLPSIVPDMLNRAILGSYGFTTDIGGYADFADGKGPDAELYLRWTEAAVFTTHFRVHNSALSGVRMPWSFGPDVEATWKAMAALHVRARSLLERLWNDAPATGTPPIRPLWLDHPGAEHNPHQDDEWMVGPDLVAAPVLEQGATSREVWLPEGCWQRSGEGDRIEGPSTTTVDAQVDALPWFTRCGTSPLD
jgi:alpha-D-xyloside xylohydrolase